MNYLIEAVGGLVRSLMGYVEFFLGGLFGLYVILVVLRWKESRKLVLLMTGVNENLKNLNKKIGADIFEHRKVFKELSRIIRTDKLKKEKAPAAESKKR